MVGLVLETDGFTKNDFRKILDGYFTDHKETTDSNGLTGELFRFYLKSIEDYKIPANQKVVVPGSKKGIETLNNVI